MGLYGTMGIVPRICSAGKLVRNLWRGGAERPRPRSAADSLAPFLGPNRDESTPNPPILIFSCTGLRGPTASTSSSYARGALIAASSAPPRTRPVDRRATVVVRADAFGDLTRNISKAVSQLAPDARLTPENMKEPLRDIRRALLEADVSLPVVRAFIKRVEESAAGAQVVAGVTPGQQLVKSVYGELKDLMGGTTEGLVEPEEGAPQVVLMAGLQGVGKTTACGKLAMYLKKQDKRVLLVATDVYRPAAVDQLVKLGEQTGTDVFELGTDVPPPEIARRGVEKARAEGYDAVIVDTAGRLQVDQAMMEELRATAKEVNATDTLLVVDAMTGQEAANLVRSFAEQVNLTGAVLTKLDGDSRGGAALSVRATSGKPIKFTGVGEKMEALEVFYPDRMAQRILGMGDVLTLVEKAEEAIKEEDAEYQLKRIMSAKFDFNDFLSQYKQVTGMGSMGEVMKMMPGMGSLTEKQLSAAEKAFKQYESMIQSMTPAERERPELLAASPSRRRRVARGSGRTDKEIASLIGTFTKLRVQMRSVARMMAAGGTMPEGVMDDEELIQSALADSGPRPVRPGLVRRKRRVRLVNPSGKGFA